jgi:hypothetical protein
MLNFKLWLEVKYTSDTLQQIRDKVKANEISHVWLDAEGNVRLGYSDRGGGRGRPPEHSYAKYIRSMKNDITMYPSEKKISLEMMGDKIKPAHKKLIDFLIKNGIIDDTWKFKGGDEIGRYVGYDWQTFTDPDLPTTVGAAKKTKLFSPAIENIILYHGTTNYGWDKIQKDGALYPLFTGSNTIYGSESRGKHPLNKDHIYLATNQDKGWHYAKQMAESLTRKLKTEAKPVLLQVKVPDVTKLRSDDDIINSRM